MSVAASRGPDSLAELAAETGATVVVDIDAEGVRKALAEASPERKHEMRATPNSSLGKPI